MTVTILIDMDDTLLYNNMDTFLPAYLQGLGSHLHQRVNSKHLIKSLLDATGKMVQKNLPAKTLEETFDAHFYPAIGFPKVEIDNQIRQFYSTKFPLLQSLTLQNPSAIRMVQEFFSRGWDVVIATNPLFPRTAILQRLDWAGLSADQYPYRLVPSFEYLHFSKPNPAYYAELLGQIGWPDCPTVVIGNSLTDDIQPAIQLGLPAFWLTENPGSTILPKNSASGSIDEIIPWIETIVSQDFSPFGNSTEAGLAVLQATPAALETRSCNFTDMIWNISPASGEWSTTEILCHLHDVDAEVNIPRIQRILKEDNPLLSGIDTDDWAQTRSYALQSGPKALAGFMKVRMEMLGLLVNLPAKAWQLPARHTIFGRTTLQELVLFMATHDRSHLQQFCRASNCNSSDLNNK